MAKEKKGSIITKNNKIYARLQFIDQFGKKRDLWRTAPNKKQAQSILKTLIEESETKTSQELDASRMTLNQLADFYEENYLHDAIYLNERKISGLRSVYNYKSLLRQIRSYFGNRLIHSITHTEILQYKIKRLNTPTHHNKPRGIADVNHALQMLRRLFSIAVRQGWLNKSPFQKGDSLISIADAPHRTRILTFEEEKRLFEAIDSDNRRIHIKGITLIALDLAFRKNEVLTLTKKDCDFTNRTITIRAFNSKTAKSRTVAMTSRVYEWLFNYTKRMKDDERIFPIRTFQTSWWNVLKIAKIEDFHYHDLRASAISRMIAAGLPIAETMRVSGHLTLACVFRYIRIDDSAIHRVANVMDNYLISQNQNSQETQSNLIN